MALETKLLYSRKEVSTSLSIIKSTRDNFSQIKDDIAAHALSGWRWHWCWTLNRQWEDLEDAFRWEPLLKKMFDSSITSLRRYGAFTIDMAIKLAVTMITKLYKYLRRIQFFCNQYVDELVEKTINFVVTSSMCKSLNWSTEVSILGLRVAKRQGPNLPYLAVQIFSSKIFESWCFEIYIILWVPHDTRDNRVVKEYAWGLVL